MDREAKQLFDQCRQALLPYYPATEAQSMAFLLLEHLFQLDKMQVLINQPIQTIPQVLQVLDNALRRLQQYEPIQYITKQAEFYGLPFRVKPGVLIPRPETEELVAWIIQDFQSQPLTLLDIGTGSGCIAVTLAKNMPQAQVNALDVSNEALTIAQQNAALNKVNIQWIAHNILAPSFTHFADQSLDVIVSNPPYVTPAEQAQMHENVLKHEPALALFVPQNEPLLFYEAITQVARQKLKPQGALYFEINEQFGAITKKMIEQQGFQEVEVRKDLFGKDRMVKAVGLSG
ncbi:peptide chain release factor N(5)-glutamine methyltransferase [Microscilla marina]|uniref:Release factor glutamine methyltransferase n=1 Tax=Microscilla marina ATCC 23134 TaxID=313606 RepID=A1ZCC3_MICM2|nr:peptide chain release factor N(5)-glutamine methyltransferase [Microscilla marina]EAY31925.1 protoporphyrinogen oxidase [Microscilla marina ATCC 23134]